jgi:hypothetical protein
VLQPEKRLQIDDRDNPTPRLNDPRDPGCGVGHRRDLQRALDALHRLGWQRALGAGDGEEQVLWLLRHAWLAHLLQPPIRHNACLITRAARRH